MAITITDGITITGGIRITSGSGLGTLGDPGISAQAIYNAGQTTSGWYYIQTSSMVTARQVYCNMTDEGGGWMLIAYTPGFLWYFCRSGSYRGSRVIPTPGKTVRVHSPTNSEQALWTYGNTMEWRNARRF
jgi:hypothetical protein